MPLFRLCGKNLHGNCDPPAPICQPPAYLALLCDLFSEKAQLLKNRDPFEHTQNLINLFLANRFLNFLAGKRPFPSPTNPHNLWLNGRFVDKTCYNLRIIHSSSRVKMYIADIIWLPQIIDKLAWKHNVFPEEVGQVMFSRPVYRKVQQGHLPGEDVYAALGRTDGGRYLVVFFIYKASREALIISARDMDKKERRQYERK